LLQLVPAKGFDHPDDTLLPTGALLISFLRGILSIWPPIEAIVSGADAVTLIPAFVALTCSSAGVIVELVVTCLSEA
jgi:hypothetical protein